MTPPLTETELQDMMNLAHHVLACGPGGAPTSSHELAAKVPRLLDEVAQLEHDLKEIVRLTGKRWR